MAAQPLVNAMGAEIRRCYSPASSGGSRLVSLGLGAFCVHVGLGGQGGVRFTGADPADRCPEALKVVLLP